MSRKAEEPAPPPLKTLGSLCTGYGGLDIAVEAVIGPLQHLWHAEIDPDASKVLAAHWPDVPNLGDLRAADWSSVEPADVVTAGFPCQPVSSAGRRQGVTDERWLFDDICTAISRMVARPRLLVFENVRGLLTANRGHAMARVVQGLASLGYVGRYGVFRASDVGAPHRRERVFIVAHLADAEGIGWGPAGLPIGTGAALSVAGVDSHAADRSDGLTFLPTPQARDGDGRGEGSPEHRKLRAARTGQNIGGPVLAEVVCHLLPTPRVAATRTGRTAILGSAAAPSLDQALELARGELPRELVSLDEAPPSWRLLPTPRASNFGQDEDPEVWTARNAEVAAGRSKGASGMPLGVALRLLPTPLAGDSHDTRSATVRRSQPRGHWTLADVAYADRWGVYGPAVARWERVTGQPAPEPIELGTKGQARLSPRFAEWMMGLPPGYVTDILPRNASLRVLGNGVVWQQAAYACADLLTRPPSRGRAGRS